MDKANMIKEVLDELKNCNKELQLVEKDENIDMYHAYIIRECIKNIKNISNKICDISDCRIIPVSKKNGIHSSRGRFFKTAKDLLEFLLSLSERDLSKAIKIGKNEWDANVYMCEVGRIYNVDWIRNDKTNILICCK